MTIPAAQVVPALRAAGCVFAEEEARLLLAADPVELEALLARRVAGEPLEQVLGWASFSGLRVPVAPGVFVPRRRTELLARAAAASARDGAVVVELCCGAAAVSLVVGHAVTAALHACDISAEAVQCAARNVAPLGGQVYRGDLYGALPASLRGQVDVLVANAPYIPSEAVALLPPEARLHEPRVALDGGADGLDVQRRIVAGAPAWLASGGTLLLETSEHQAPTTAALMRAVGLRAEVVRDESLDATVVRGHSDVQADRAL